MTRTKTPLTYAEKKARRQLAHDIVGYDANTCPLVWNKTKIEVLELIEQLADAGDTFAIKEVVTQFKKRLVQDQLVYTQKRS